MADSRDLDSLARQYLDLWQSQIDSLAGDADITGMMAQALESLAAGPDLMALHRAMAQAMSGFGGMGKPDDGTTPQDGNTNLGPDAGAEAAAAPHGDPGLDVDEFTRRITELESRIAGLETGSG